MSGVVELLCSRRAPHAAVLALISIGFAGCSADMSTRIAQNNTPSNQSGHFGWQREATGSVVSAPAAPVERRELPQYARPQTQTQSQYQSSELPPPISTPKSYPLATGTSGGGRGLTSYTPPAHPTIDSTGSVPPRSVAARG